MTRYGSNTPADYGPCFMPECETQIGPRLLMCGKCWADVPPRMKSALWAAHVPGIPAQEAAKNNRAYRELAWQCVLAVYEARGVELDERTRYAYRQLAGVGG